MTVPAGGLTVVAWLVLYPRRTHPAFVNFKPETYTDIKIYPHELKITAYQNAEELSVTVDLLVIMGFRRRQRLEERYADPILGVFGVGIFLGT